MLVRLTPRPPSGLPGRPAPRRGGGGGGEPNNSSEYCIKLKGTSVGNCMLSFSVLCSVSRTATKGLLMHLGCDVTTVCSNEECLRVISHEHQVVLLDVCMPGIDGYELAVSIREKFAKREKPLIIALTGNTDKATKENCTRVGINGVIQKPVSVDRMRSIFVELLEQRVL